MSNVFTPSIDSCNCQLPGGVFSCFDEYGEEVTGTDIPSWGLCEKTDCGSDKYPDPLSFLCDGDTNDWSPNPSTITCKGILVICKQHCRYSVFFVSKQLLLLSLIANLFAN